MFGNVTSEERVILETIARIRRRKCFGSADGNPLEERVIAAHANMRSAKRHIGELLRKGYLVQQDEKYDLKDAFNGLYRRLRRSVPSEAVLTVFDSPRYYLHPTEPRPFTVRECARLQGFPDSFVFRGSHKNQYTQIGNAVPPPLAKAVAKSVRDHVICLSGAKALAGRA